MSNSFISWDFDYTLYNPYTEGLIGNTYKIFRNMEKNNANLCITTYRYVNELEEVRKFFPDIEIFATGRESKIVWLTHLKNPVKKHFDDDFELCIDLKKYTNIEPVWIKHHWNNIDPPAGLKFIEVTEVKKPSWIM